MNSDIQKISDALYLCSPFLCFDIARLPGGFEVTHYTPFAQKSLLGLMLGEDFTIVHRQCHNNFPEVSSADVSSPDGTLKGLLYAFKVLIKCNMPEGSDDFNILLHKDGVVSSDSPMVQSMFDMSLLPSSLKGLYSLLSYNVPIHQAYQTVSEDYTSFVDPDSYKVQVITEIGVFERNELFGTYGIKVQSIQGFLLSYEESN